MSRKWPVLGSVYNDLMAELKRNLPSSLCYHMIITVDDIPTIVVVLCGGQATTELPLDFGIPIKVTKVSITVFGIDNTARKADENESMSQRTLSKHQQPRQPPEDWPYQFGQHEPRIGQERYFQNGIPGFAR